MKTIVIGYDQSDSAERALARAAELAEALSARLVVVSVSRSARAPMPELVPDPISGLAPPAVAGPLPTAPVPPPGPAPETLEPDAVARQQLERARAALVSREVETEYVAELGDPAERLLAVAEHHDADLIVVGSREHGLLERLLGPPVEEAVARRSERDVLLVH